MSRRGKLLVGIGIIAALLTVTVATLPIWFRWVLRPVLRTYGVRFESYQAVGSSKFVLLGVQGEYKDVRIESARLEAPLPTRWIWSRYFGDDGAPPSLQSTNWRLILKTRVQRGAASPAPASTFEVLQDIEANLAGLRSWLPAARLTNGIVEVNAERIAVPSVEWKRGRLVASLGSPRFKETIDLKVDLSRSGRYAIAAKAESSGATFEAELKRAADSWQLEGQTLWRSNRVETTARFGRQGWWPQQARLAADSIRVPTDLAKLEGYEDLRGAFTFDWAQERFHLDASAQANPKPGSSESLLPAALTLAARGDAESMVVEKLKLTGPGLEADLSDSVGITRTGKLLTDAASLKLSLDLAKLPWTSMGGMLQGLVRIRPGETNSLQALFELSGTGLTHEGLELRQVDLAGELNWPLLELRRADVKFADASTFGGSAQVDLKSRTVRDGRWQFEGRLPRARLPEGFSYSKLRTTGQFSGSLTQPIHSGQVIVEGFSIPHFNSSNVSANWRGEKFDLSQVEAQFSAGVSTLSLSGAVRLAETKDQSSSIVLQTLTFQRSNQSVYVLQEPCKVSFRQAGEKDPGWEARVAALHWAGAQREIRLAGEVEWPRHGNVQSHWQGVALDDFADLVPLPARKLTLSKLDLTAKWDNGPMELELSTQVGSSATDSSPFSGQAELRVGAAGLNVERLVISSPSGAVVSMQGTVPVALMPGPRAGWLRWDEKKPIDLRATTAPNKSFWDSVRDLTGVRLLNPELDVTIRGSLAQPEGLLRLHAEQLGWKFATNRVALPAMDNLNVEADFKRDRVHLKTLTIELEGQPVRASGELPLVKSFWTDLLAKRELPDWHQATGRIEIADAPLALLARYLPEILSPQGRLTLDLGIQPGAKLNGELQITDAATRPLVTLGHIHDIHALIKFTDRGARIEQFSGQVGGEPVSLTGVGSLAEKNGLQFEAALRGTNVPLVRAPGVLLRSDLNIQLSQKVGQAATISGEATLHDSLFLQDLKSLVPAGPTQQSQRPPYFSVEQEPFAGWRLNLRVNGEKFLRVRTPLFRGEISASFQLTGKMKEPVALGEARIASGLVQFPFGTLTIDQGYATLTSENPYQPHLFVIASGRTYGYATKMEVSGPAEEPRVAFTSTPPLTSEQIILMLTAGELPREDVRFSQQQRATRLAVFLGKGFLSRLIGDEAAAERLTIRSGENFSNEGKLTYDLEYRLTEDWSVIGEYDRFNALNAGLKWRIFSK